MVLPLGESEIILPSGAAGTLFLASEKAGPFVIMYHGYASIKDEVGNMYKDEAKRLGELGISSLRIGYRGWDDKGFGEEFITVDTMMTDAQEALDFGQSLRNVKSKQIGLLGFSMGGGIAQLISGMNPDDIAAVATWSSAIEFASLVNDEDKKTARQDGTVTINPGWRSIVHSKGFVDSIDQYFPIETFEAYSKPLLIVDGTDDFLYPNTAVLKKLRPDAEVYEIDGADHIYHVLSDDQSMARDVIEKTAEWFESTL